MLNDTDCQDFYDGFEQHNRNIWNYCTYMNKKTSYNSKKKITIYKDNI